MQRGKSADFAEERRFPEGGGSTKAESEKAETKQRSFLPNGGARNGKLTADLRLSALITNTAPFFCRLLTSGHGGCVLGRESMGAFFTNLQVRDASSQAICAALSRLADGRAYVSPAHKVKQVSSPAVSGGVPLCAGSAGGDTQRDAAVTRSRDGRATRAPLPGYPVSSAAEQHREDSGVKSKVTDFRRLWKMNSNLTFS